MDGNLSEKTLGRLPDTMASEWHEGSRAGSGDPAMIYRKEREMNSSQNFLRSTISGLPFFKPLTLFVTPVSYGACQNENKLEGCW
jgi:hypothetical protein